MTKDEALKLALVALENAVRYHGIMLMADPPQAAWKYHRVEDNAKQAITAIKEALAQPAQPVQEPPQYSLKAHWTDDKRIGVVACVTRPDGGVHLMQTIIDPPPPVQEQKPVGQLQENVYGRGQVLWFNKPADKAMLYTDPPVAYDKTEMNSLVIDLYEEKMKEGKHGHYEALFHCVHQAIKRAAHGIKENT